MKKATTPNMQDLLSLQPFEVLASPQAMSYVVNVFGDFEEPAQFEDIVSILENAGENDHMRINLGTSGGTLHSILPLLGAMENTDCHVHVHACSDVASAGTFLLMKAHSVSINNYVTIMCHQISFGSMGSGNTVETHVLHTMKSSGNLIKDMYHNFFSEDEIARMLTGSDFYMDSDEFLLRYYQRDDLDKLEYEKSQEVVKPTKKLTVKEDVVSKKAVIKKV